MIDVGALTALNPKFIVESFGVIGVGINNCGSYSATARVSLNINVNPLLIMSAAGLARIEVAY